MSMIGSGHTVRKMDTGSRTFGHQPERLCKAMVLAQHVRLPTDDCLGAIDAIFHVEAVAVSGGHLSGEAVSGMMAR